MNKRNRVIASLLILGSSMFSTSQQLGQHPQPDSRIKCSLTAANLVWNAPESTNITIRLENVSDEDIEIDASANLTLTPNLSYALPGASSFWAPIDIEHNTPAAIDEDPPGTIKLRHTHLTVSKRSTSRFYVHAANMKWNRQISSVWPSFSLKIVPAGQYTLHLETTSERGQIMCTAANVEIGKPSQNKP